MPGRSGAVVGFFTLFNGLPMLQGDKVKVKGGRAKEVNGS